MLRLAGLPHVGRYPVATARRMEEHIEVHFGGRGDEQVMNVPLRYLDGEDEEAAELRLLAQLQQIGYEVRRRE
ncbi:MAG: hypothetical protein ACFB50_05630 [Rubrobacteraceae bacterium]